MATLPLYHDTYHRSINLKRKFCKKVGTSIWALPTENLVKNGWNHTFLVKIGPNMCMIPSIVQWIFKRKFYKKVGIKKWGQGSVHIRKWYWGHLYLKKWQNGTFSIILPQNWRQLTSNIGFWPKIDIQCTHWHQISIKTTIKTINKWYSGHLYLKNW